MKKPNRGERAASNRALTILVGVIILFTACAEAPAGQDLIENGNEELFRPPSPEPRTPLVILNPSPTTELLPQEGIIFPSPTPTCENGLKFLDDLSFPDGTIVDPGTLIDKRWRIQNAGTCNWDNRYRLRIVSGSIGDVMKEQALYPARGGMQAVIRIVFTAPLDSGSYRISWQAFDPLGEPFGDLIFIEFVVATP